MQEDIHNVKETTTRSGNTVQKTTEVRDLQPENEHQRNVIERIVWFVAGIILVLLAFRFLLSLLGANTTNNIADFIYTTSQPFVAPFFSLFKYNDYVYGESRLEIYTLVAMLFYAIIAWGVTKLVTINRN